eukprot:jgi/Mesvir1/9082/Mv21359-RA.1
MDQDKWTDHTRVWAAVFQARGGVLANSCTPAKRWMWVQNLALRHSDAPVAREIPPAPWWFDIKGFFQHRTGVADRKEKRDWAVEYMQKYELCLTVGEQEEAFLEDCSASGVYDLTDLLQLRAVRKHLSEHGVQPPAWVDATIRNLRQRLTLNYHNHTGKGGKKSDALTHRLMWPSADEEEQQMRAACQKAARVTGVPEGGGRQEDEEMEEPEDDAAGQEDPTGASMGAHLRTFLKASRLVRLDPQAHMQLSAFRKLFFHDFLELKTSCSRKVTNEELGDLLRPYGVSIPNKRVRGRNGERVAIVAGVASQEEEK